MRWFWGPVPPWGVCIADRFRNPLSAWKTKQSLFGSWTPPVSRLCAHMRSLSHPTHLHPARWCPRMLQWRRLNHLKPRGLGSGIGFLADLTGAGMALLPFVLQVVGSSPCCLDHWSCHLLCLWVTYFLFNFIKYVFTLLTIIYFWLHESSCCAGFL